MTSALVYSGKKYKPEFQKLIRSRRGPEVKGSWDVKRRKFPMSTKRILYVVDSLSSSPPKGLTHFPCEILENVSPVRLLLLRCASRHSDRRSLSLAWAQWRGCVEWGSLRNERAPDGTGKSYSSDARARSSLAWSVQTNCRRVAWSTNPIRWPPST